LDVSKTYALLFLEQVGESPFDDFPEKPLVLYCPTSKKHTVRLFFLQEISQGSVHYFTVRSASSMCTFFASALALNAASSQGRESAAPGMCSCTCYAQTS